MLQEHVWWLNIEIAGFLIIFIRTFLPPQLRFFLFLPAKQNFRTLKIIITWHIQWQELKRQWITGGCSF